MIKSQAHTHAVQTQPFCVVLNIWQSMSPVLHVLIHINFPMTRLVSPVSLIKDTWVAWCNDETEEAKSEVRD